MDRSVSSTKVAVGRTAHVGSIPTGLTMPACPASPTVSSAQTATYAPNVRNTTNSRMASAKRCHVTLVNMKLRVHFASDSLKFKLTFDSNSDFQDRCRTLIRESALIVRWDAKRVPQVKLLETLEHIQLNLFSSLQGANNLCLFINREPRDLQQLYSRLLSVSFCIYFIYIA